VLHKILGAVIWLLLAADWVVGCSNPGPAVAIIIVFVAVKQGKSIVGIHCCKGCSELSMQFKTVQPAQKQQGK